MMANVRNQDKVAGCRWGQNTARRADTVSDGSKR